MQVLAVEISNLRVVEHLKLNPRPGVNLIVGTNGSGKTSLLEGIYLAGRGRTFRHAEAGPMIRRGSDQAMVVVHLVNEATGQRSVLGISRERRSFSCRLNGEEVRRRSTLAEALPVQWVGPQPQVFLSAGPDVRRRFLDMGLFHVEHSYLTLLNDFHKALRQRNAAIRGGNRRGVQAWDQTFARLSVALLGRRQVFVERLMQATLAFLDVRRLGLNLDYRYKSGWKADQPLEDQLHRRLDTDLKVGYTGIGPHRAELEITCDGLPAERSLSRGQQKLLVLAMNLALLDLVTAERGDSPVLLIDDLAAELDQGNRQMIVEELRSRPTQAFITAIDEDSLECGDKADETMFHVEHGALK